MKTRTVWRAGLAAILFCFAPAWGADADAVSDLIDRAEAARQRAAALEYEWRFTAKRIKEAKAALDSGDLETARTKAERAIEQAAISEAVWELAVPK